MAERYVTVLDADKRTPQMKVWARENDKKVHKLLMKRMSSIPENNECADCSARRPGWAALPHGIHICINCAQIHRRIGRHISQVKAINTGTYLWYQDEYQCMVTMGNSNARRLYTSVGAPPKPKESDSVAKKEAYIRDVYELQKFLNPNFHPQSASRKNCTKQPNNRKSLVKKGITQQKTKNIIPPLLSFEKPSESADQKSYFDNVIKTQSASSDSLEFQTNIDDRSEEVDFFAMFEMQPITATQSQAATKAKHKNDDFSDILALYRN